MAGELIEYERKSEGAGWVLGAGVAVGDGKVGPYPG
jgi:hypothetical protein